MNCRIGRSEHCEKWGCEWEKGFGICCKDQKEEPIPLYSSQYVPSYDMGNFYKNKRHRLNKPKTPPAEPRYKRLWERSQGICYLCEKSMGEKYNPRISNEDHIVPLSRGGANNLSNIALVHITCNQRKGNKLLSELNLPF